MFIDFPKKTNKKTTVKFGTHPIPVASFFHPLPQLRTTLPRTRLAPCRNAFQAAPGYLLPKVQSPSPWLARKGWDGLAAASQKKLFVFDRENLRRQFFGVVFGSGSEMFGKVRKRAS